MVGIVLALAVAGGGTAAAFLLGVSGGPGTFKLVGTLALPEHSASDLQEESQYYTPEDQYTGTGNGECAGSGGYDDLSEGANLVAKDQAGDTIATGVLGDGADDGDTCTWTFTLTLPKGKSFYTFVIGHRTTPTYTEQDLEDSGVQLSIGT